MTTADSVKAKIQALIETANEKMGSSHSNLTAAVGQLLSGFGQGGASDGTQGIYMAKVTPAKNAPDIHVTHQLGTTDILLAAVFVESFGDNQPPDASENLGNIWAKADMPAIRGGVGYDIKFTWARTLISNSTAQSAGSYCMFPNENTVRFYGASPNMYFLAGVTHTVIIIPASAFKETEG